VLGVVVLGATVVVLVPAGLGVVEPVGADPIGRDDDGAEEVGGEFSVLPFGGEFG